MPIPQDKIGLPDETVKKIQRVFSRHPEVEKVILYGSRAKGNFRQGSDIDLTIECTTVPDSMVSKIDWELDDLLLPYKFDLSLRSEIGNPDLLAHIDRVGIVFYERKQYSEAKL